MVVINCPEFLELEDELDVFNGVKGSIVRLYMEDFVTYRKVEMRAGPHVNLILGLNGTGKSTIVSAICLGLAGKPTILGRASSLKAYIRHGAESCKIETELFNPDGTNFIIQRLIRETEKGCVSNWILNNKRVKLEKIEELTKNLNIQLDNLCQFLPQDRVQEFAEMNSISLLASTEEAIGNDTLSTNHKKLVDISTQIGQTDAMIDKVTDNLRHEQQLNLSLETEVQTYHQMEEVKKRIEVLELNIAWIKWGEAEAVFNLAQSDLRELTTKKMQEENSLAPLKKAIENLESQLLKFREQMQKLIQKNDSKLKAIQQRYDKEKDSAALSVSEIVVHLNQAERREEEKKKRYNLLLAKEESYKLELDNFLSVGEHDENVLKQHLAELENQRTDVMREVIKIQRLDEKDKADKSSLNHRITTAEAELGRFDDFLVSRMKFLERSYPDVVKALKHFETPGSKSRFKGKIHDPMILYISLNDLTYGGIAERHLGISDLTAFFCEEEDDIEALLEFSNELKIRISAIHHHPPTRFVKNKTNITAEQMKKYHFKKVLIDLLEAPDYYMSYLCGRFFPEDVPIGTNETDKFSKDIIDLTNIRTFYTVSYSYNIQVSVYSGQKCTTTSYIQGLTPRIFTSEINATERSKLQANIRSMKEEYQKLSDNINSRSDRLKTRQNDKEVVAEKIKDTNAKIERRISLEQKVKVSKDSADKLEKELVDLTDMRQQTKQDCFERRTMKLSCLEDVRVNELCSNGRHHSVIKRQSSVLHCRFITKQNQYEDVKHQLDEANKLIAEFNIRVKAAGENSERLKKEAIKKGATDRPPQGVIDGMMDITELEKSLNSERGRIIIARDISVVKQYEDKLKEIEDLKKEKEILEQKSITLKSQLQSVKTAWLGPLKDLIERINKNFSGFFRSMQCGGAVYLKQGDKEDDFGKYGIQIKVSFRAGEQLSELCGWKQSGGERAITTALYVLALQELTTVPFRVIDEINQGMDSKNEARFFDLLCRLADGTSSPQYFLLTPKMLPAVDYPDNVCFHFILNGPHVKDMFEDSEEEQEPEPGDDGTDLGQYEDFSGDTDVGSEGGEDEEGEEEAEGELEEVEEDSE